MRRPCTNAEIGRRLAVDAVAVTQAVEALRRVVEQRDAKDTLDLLVAARPGVEASDEAWAWARRRSAPVVRRSRLPRSA